jgi:hypothetical protein
MQCETSMNPCDYYNLAVIDFGGHSRRLCPYGSMPVGPQAEGKRYSVQALTWRTSNLMVIVISADGS